ncbi:MAG TPA: hypothetical protein VE641_16745 [Chthoniobacterales bacterium]|nr:hypothetical protein [Chthoniobacterales bacterium]
MKGSSNAINCAAEKGRLQFLFFFEQRRRRILFRRDPTSEPTYSAEDDVICAEGLGRELIEQPTESERSRLGWGITHI